MKNPQATQRLTRAFAKPRQTRAVVQLEKLENAKDLLNKDSIKIKEKNPQSTNSFPAASNFTKPSQKRAMQILALSNNRSGKVTKSVEHDKTKQKKLTKAVSSKKGNSPGPVTGGSKRKSSVTNASKRSRKTQENELSGLKPVKVTGKPQVKPFQQSHVYTDIELTDVEDMKSVEQLFDRVPVVVLRKDSPESLARKMFSSPVVKLQSVFDILKSHSSPTDFTSDMVAMDILPPGNVHVQHETSNQPQSTEGTTNISPDSRGNGDSNIQTNQGHLGEMNPQGNDAVVYRGESHSPLINGPAINDTVSGNIYPNTDSQNKANCEPPQSESDKTGSLNAMNGSSQTSVDKVALIHQASDTANTSQQETICQATGKDNRTDAISRPDGTDLNGCPPPPSNLDTGNSQNSSISNDTGNSGNSESDSVTCPSSGEMQPTFSSSAGSDMSRNLSEMQSNVECSGTNMDLDTGLEPCDAGSTGINSDIPKALPDVQSSVDHVETDMDSVQVRESHDTGYSESESVTLASQVEKQGTISSNTPRASPEMQWDVITDMDLLANANARLQKHLRGLALNKDGDHEGGDAMGSNKADCVDSISSLSQSVTSQGESLNSDVKENSQGHSLNTDGGEHSRSDSVNTGLNGNPMGDSLNTDVLESPMGDSFDTCGGENSENTNIFEDANISHPENSVAEKSLLPSETNDNSQDNEQTSAMSPDPSSLTSHDNARTDINNEGPINSEGSKESIRSELMFVLSHAVDESIKSSVCETTEGALTELEPTISQESNENPHDSHRSNNEVPQLETESSLDDILGVDAKNISESIEKEPQPDTDFSLDDILKGDDSENPFWKLVNELK